MAARRLPLCGNGDPASGRERADRTLRLRLITLHLEPGVVVELPRLLQELSIGKTPLVEAVQRYLSLHEPILRAIEQRDSVGAGMAAITHVLESNIPLLSMFQTATAMSPATALAKRGAADDH